MAALPLAALALVRVMALERGIRPTSTLERLDALAEDGRLEARFAEQYQQVIQLRWILVNTFVFSH